MEITEHQANMFRALADGKRLQVVDKAVGDYAFDLTTLDNFMLFITDTNRYEVRIKPDVIVVNGIEVPAPEKVAPALEAEYWIANVVDEDGLDGPLSWAGNLYDRRVLKLGILHLSPEAASAHGIAMRAHKPG